MEGPKHAECLRFAKSRCPYLASPNYQYRNSRTRPPVYVLATESIALAAMASAVEPHQGRLGMQKGNSARLDRHGFR
jgi:hypothetical protein